MCDSTGKAVAVCAGCGVTEEAPTLLDMYDLIAAAGWGQLEVAGLLLCAGCVERVSKRLAMMANAHLN